jgi:hypothetical protein
VIARNDRGNSGRFVLASLTTGLVAVLAAPAARAEHHNRGNHVLAAAPCLPGAANTATSTGVPACSPPLPRSSCVVQPADGVAMTGRSKFMTVPLGRTATPWYWTTYVVSTFQSTGMVDCDGQRFGGAVQAPIVARITTDDPACTGGRCTLPDSAAPFTVDCKRGLCDERYYSFGGPTPPPFPAGRPWTAVILGWSVLDSGGVPVLNPGLMIGYRNGTEPITFPLQSPNWEGRFVQAYEPCLPGTEDTTTSEGFPACSSPRPLSSCAVDPAGAVDVERPTGTNYDGARGKGKLEMATDPTRSEAFLRHAKFDALLTCTGAPYQGPLTLVATVRATLADPACAGGYCTTVDTEVRMPVTAFAGRVKVLDTLFPMAAAFRAVRSADPLNVEILGFDLRDRADRPIMSGPGYLVRCDRAGNPDSCFGN